MSLLDSLTKDEITEMPMIEIMFLYLQNEKEPINFYTLMDHIAKYKGWSQAEMRDRLVQAYTDMNIDGRFVTLGDNQWGLKRWYPVEKTEEQLATMITPKKKEKEPKEGDFDDYNEKALEDFEEEIEEEEEEDGEKAELDEDAVDEELIDDEFVDDEIDEELDEEFEPEEEEETET